MTHYPKFFLNKGRILALWVMYTTYKTVLKVQIIGILEGKDSFDWPKMHSWKGDKKFGQDKIHKNSSFFSGNRPLLQLHNYTVLLYYCITVFLYYCISLNENCKKCQCTGRVWDVHISSQFEIGKLLVSEHISMDLSYSCTIGRFFFSG